MSGAPVRIITFTGITGQLREHYKSVVAGLEARYSGSLQAGYTTHLVVAGEVEQLRVSAKVQLAQATSIPLVSLQWLDDSHAHGFLLDHESYLVCLASPQLARLLTKESASGLYVPSIEKLRQHAAPAAFGEFLDVGLGADIIPDNMASMPNRKLSLQHEAFPDLLRSPLQDGSCASLFLSTAADPSISFFGQSQPNASLGQLHYPTEAVDPMCLPEAVSAGEPSSKQQRFPVSRKRSRADGAMGARHDAQGAENVPPHRMAECGPGSTSGSILVAKACSVRAVAQSAGDCVVHSGLGAQPCSRPLGIDDGVGKTAALEWPRRGSRGVGALAPAGGSRDAVLGNMMAGTDVQTARGSDGCHGIDLPIKLATANITVRRGRRPRRQHAAAPGAGIDPTKLTLLEPALGPCNGSLRGGTSKHAAEQAATGPPQTIARGASPGEPAACTSPSAPASGWQPLSASGTSDGGGCSLPGALEPDPADVPDPASSDTGDIYLNGGLLRYKPTTKVHLGAQMANSPSHNTACSVRNYHSLRSLQGVTFYSSATLELADGRILVYQAGEAAHGVKMVYNLQPDGSEHHAFALVLSIYQLSGSNDVYFEHRYFLTVADLEERPAWKGFLKEAVVRQDELLLTLGSYHSPMALCIDEFGLAYTGHAQLKSDPLPSAAGKYSPLLECRRGFDTERGRGVSLRMALCDLR